MGMEKLIDDLLGDDENESGQTANDDKNQNDESNDDDNSIFDAVVTVPQSPHPEDMIDLYQNCNVDKSDLDAANFDLEKKFPTKAEGTSINDSENMSFESDFDHSDIVDDLPGIPLLTNKISNLFITS